MTSAPVSLWHAAETTFPLRTFSDGTSCTSFRADRGSNLFKRSDIDGQTISARGQRPVAPPRQAPSAIGASETPSVESLHQRIAQLTAAIAARDAFIAVAAHELRNPMTPIMGQIDLLLARIRAGRCPPEEMERRLERLHQAVRRYLQRAAVLLNVSRITSGKLQLEPEPLDLGQLLREAVDDFADPARRAGISISLDAVGSLPGTWDRLALEQIIDNLVSNAFKYGGRTPIELCAEACEGHVCIQVRDHGHGIAAEDRQRVFQRFERAVGKGEQSGGFGVGLWVVGQLVEAMGGSVAIDDAPGGGALFTVTLPQHVREAQP